MPEPGPNPSLTSQEQDRRAARGAARVQPRPRGMRAQRLVGMARRMWLGLALVLLSVAGVVGGGVLWALGHGGLAARLLAADVLVIFVLLVLPGRRK